MRTTLLIALALAAAPLEVGAAHEPDRVARDFALANELALKGERDGAIRLYETLVQQGVEHQDLFLNLGNAYAESKREVDAIVAYERGLRLAPGDVDLKKNLELLRGRIEGKPDKTNGGQEGTVSLADAIEPFVSPLPLQPFAWATVAADVGLFLALIALRRARASGARRASGIIAVVSASALLVGGAVVGGHYVLARDPRAVVTEASDMKEGPHERFKNKGRAPAGARVRVLEEDGAFVRVLREDGTSGWVRAQTVTRV